MNCRRRQIFLLAIMLTMTFLRYAGYDALYAQEKDESQRIRILEQKLLVIEDYLNNRLSQLQQKIEAQEQSLQLLREQNAQLQRDVQYLKEHLQTAEVKILKLEIEFIKSPEQVKNTSEKTESSSVKIVKDKDIYTEPAVLKWLPALRSPNANIRMGAVIELGKIDHKEATVALMSALQDETHHIQMLACKILARKKSSDAISHMWPLLQSPNLEVRRIACEALQNITELKPSCGTETNERIWKEATIEWRKQIEAKGLWSKPSEEQR